MTPSAEAYHHALWAQGAGHVQLLPSAYTTRPEATPLEQEEGEEQQEGEE